jgi:hypothetical protein
MKSKPHLFPHSYIPEPEIKKLISFFGPFRIYQPWFMNPPGFFNDSELEVVNPPEHLKPGEDFKAILSGYRSWAEQNHDKSRREIIKFSDNACRDDSATWEIRRLLKGITQPVPGTRGDDLHLKRHVLLHLASEMERQHFELMSMMRALKEKRPVLAGALHDPDEAEGIFADMDDITTAVMPDSLNIGSMLDAWFGLFSGYINDNDLLITCDSRVLDYLSTQWDERTSGEKVANSQAVLFNMPVLYSEALKKGDITRIRKLILGFGEDPGGSICELNRLAGEIEENYSASLSKDALRINLKYFPSMSCISGTPCEKDIVKNIDGKTLVLVE